MTNEERDIIHFKTNHPLHSSEEIAKVFGVSKVHVNCTLHNFGLQVAIKQHLWREKQWQHIQILNGGLS